MINTQSNGYPEMGFKYRLNIFYFENKYLSYNNLTYNNIL